MSMRSLESCCAAHRRLAAVAAGALLLAGCGRGGQEMTQAPRTPPPPESAAATTEANAATDEAPTPSEDHPPGVLTAYVWECEDGRSFVAKNLFEEDAISLDLPDGTRRLAQLRSGSGARYGDGELVFWSKGRSATLGPEDGPTTNCTEVRAKSLETDARLRGVVYRGLGNEPGWVLEIGPDGRLAYETNYGQDHYVFQGATSSGDEATGLEYRAEQDDTPIAVTVTREPCRDDMAGDEFDYSFVVEFGGRTYRGCGSSLR
jgi:membrane-bound inhibitor of C-type lysozyme